MERYMQMSLFPERTISDSRQPVSVTWNLWHGCTQVSSGCTHCYMFRRDESIGKDPTVVRKTQSFNLPVRRFRTGIFKGFYKIPSGSTFFTCFTSDFFHKSADDWRPEAWSMMRERSDCIFFMITKRPERIDRCLPTDWGNGYDNVHICCTCENQYWADKRLPVFLSLPLAHKSITHEPMLESINIRPFLKKFRNPDGSSMIESVAVGGESGPDARVCDYAWVLDTHVQCVEYGVPFHYHQTGAKLKKGDKIYEIERHLQHEQAHKAHLDFDGIHLPAWDETITNTSG